MDRTPVRGIRDSRRIAVVGVVIVGDRQRELLKASLVIRPMSCDPGVKGCVVQEKSEQRNHDYADKGNFFPHGNLPRMFEEAPNSIRSIGESYCESCH